MLFVLLDPFQRLQMARHNEQPPGSLRLARRQQQAAHTTKPVANQQRKTVVVHVLMAYSFVF